MDTQNDGLGKVTPFKNGNFWYQFVRFLGCIYSEFLEFPFLKNPSGISNRSNFEGWKKTQVLTAMTSVMKKTIWSPRFFRLPLIYLGKL